MINFEIETENIHRPEAELIIQPTFIECAL